MIDEEVVDYWIKTIHDDIGFHDVDTTKAMIMAIAPKLEIFTIELTGIFGYIITPDFTGRDQLCEIIFYIYPSYRGDLRLVRKYINRAELIAKRNSCKSIAIGANIRYKDNSLMKLLKRWGYLDDTVKKEF